MAQNKNALIRYRTIDKCLQNYHRKWTLNDLIEACSDALYEYEGKDVNVSKRTVQLDIQMMRSDKLGYNAPIVVYDRKYYKYENPNYSITDIPLTETDMNVLSETVEMLKQFKDFSLFSELGSIINRLEDRIYTEKTKQPSVIHFEKNENLKGLEHLDTIYQAIIKKIVLKIDYQSFRAIRKQKPATSIVIQPLILKEFNNRWFLIGRKPNDKKIYTFPLDRIKQIGFELSIDFDDTVFDDTVFDAEEYYKNTFGVTVLPKEKALNIEFLANPLNAPYIETKPLHHSQKVLERYENGSIRFGLHVHHNFEIERLFLGFGQGIEVLSPEEFRQSIYWQLKKALEKYDS